MFIIRITWNLKSSELDVWLMLTNVSFLLSLSHSLCHCHPFHDLNRIEERQTNKVWKEESQNFRPGKKWKAHSVQTPPFKNEGIEAQRREITCLRSHSKYVEIHDPRSMLQPLMTFPWLHVTTSPLDKPKRWGEERGGVHSPCPPYVWSIFHLESVFP